MKRDENEKPSALFIANRAFVITNSRLLLIKRFIDINWKVYIAANRDEFADQLDHKNCTFIEVPFALGGFKWRYDIAAIMRVRNVIQSIKPHIIHNFNPKPVMLGTYFGRRIMKRKSLIFNTITGLGYPYHMKKSTLQRVSNFIYSQVLDRANHTIFQNEKDRQRFIKSKLVSKSLSSTIVSSGVDTQRFSPKKQRSNKGNLRLLFIGQLLQQKGFYELVDAVSLLQKSGHSISVDVYGELVEDRHGGVKKEYVDAQVAAGIIIFHGFVQRIEDVFENADILVLPSYGEGTPRVVLEAAASAVPSIVCQAGWVKGVVKDGETGYVVEPKSATALADAILKFETQRSLLHIMGSAAREHIKKDFEQSKIINKYWALYEKHSDGKSFEREI